MSLRGTVYRHYHGGLRQVQALREAADGGDPLPLVTGYGDYLGMWAIVKVEETQSEPTLTGRR